MKLFVAVLPLLVAAALAEHDLENLESFLRRLDRSVKVNLNLNLHSGLPSLPDILGLREGVPNIPRPQSIPVPRLVHADPSLDEDDDIEDLNNLNLGNPLSRPRRNKGYDNFYFLPSRG
ncbi:unnamed protein product [Bursaphelenchus xylophilus]|uniref:(pine wood nematode) hypothetical protein n=1 Tax=Bursaphelenchus xylophilus TaxID=6326 RepID=A0A1I7S9S4_BURXY|nr:unnamed protein product [Bursaphelenchus xylophilus]CAG9129206.1 unnamed protein product [Bursaphelenchus xylophilus]